MPEIISREEAKARGLNKYFTGEPCVNGHISERRTSYTMCVECDRIRQLKPALREKVGAWRAEHREEIAGKQRALYVKNIDENRAKARTYQKSHKPEHNERNKKYRKKHSLKVKAYNSQWKKNNPERIAVQKAAEYRRNPEKFKAISREFFRKHPEIRRAMGARRRARVAGAEGSHTAAEVAEIRKMQKGKCAYCRTPLSKTKPHVDHIIALSRGGSNDRRNLQILCQPCNSSKHAHDPIDFARKQGMLL